MAQQTKALLDPGLKNDFTSKHLGRLFIKSGGSYNIVGWRPSLLGWSMIGVCGLLFLQRRDVSAEVWAFQPLVQHDATDFLKVLCTVRHWAEPRFRTDRPCVGRGP